MMKGDGERREYQGRETKGADIDPADMVDMNRLGGSGTVSKAVCKFRRKAGGARKT